MMDRDVQDVNEWENLPQSPEGRPQITVTRPPPPPKKETPPGQNFGPWPLDLAETKHKEAQPQEPQEEITPVPYEDIAKKISGKREPTEQPERPTVGEMAQANWDLFKRGLTEAPMGAVKSINEALDRRYYPQEAAFIGDDGQFYDKDNKPIRDQYKPTTLPLTRNPNTDSIEPAMPGALDLINTVGSPVKGAATLGAGMVRPGLGHNMPPPGPLPVGVPPHPPVAPPPPGPRQIIHGHGDHEPMTLDKLYTRVMDDLHPLKILEKKLAEHGALAPGEEFYQLARLTRGSFGRTHQALNHSTFDFHTLQNNGAGLKEVLKPVAKDLKSFEEYAIAKRDLELLNRGINTGTTPAAAQAIVNAAPAHFNQALNNLHAYQDRVLKYLRDSGVVSGQAYNDMKALNQAYVPFHRAIDGAKDLRTSGRNIKAWSPIKGIKGSDRDILSPIETIIKNTHAFIDLAEKNRALTALTDAANNRAASGLVKKVPKPMHPINVTRDEVENFLQGSGLPIPQNFHTAPDAFTIFRPNAFRPAPDEIAVFRNGKREVYKVDPEVANAVNGMGHQEVDAILKAMSVPAQALRVGATLSPEFMLRNLTRDQLTAMVFSRNGYLPFATYVNNVGHMFFKSKKYQDWLKSGGANSNLVSMDRRYMRDEIKNLTESGLLNTAKNVIDPRKLLNNLSKVSEYSEQPTRIGEFGRARKRGKSMHQAGYESREVTVDFGRRGSSEVVKAMARLTSFMNPQAQGVDRFVRSIKDAPAATTFKILAGVTAPTFLAYWYNRQDPRMKSIPEWERDIYWHVPTNDWREYQPTKTGHEKSETNQIPDNFKKTVDGKTYVNYGTIYRVSKPFEIGVAFGSSFERGLDDFFGKHPEAWKDFDKSIRSAFLPNFIPQIGNPFLETAANFNYFRDKPIVSRQLENPANRQYEYGPYTSETAKLIGRTISKITPESRLASPMMIENAILGWSGGMGRYALAVADKAIGMVGGNQKVNPEWGPADYPGLKAIVSRMPSSAAAEIGAFYENLNKSNATRALLKRLSYEGAPFGETEGPLAKTMRSQTMQEIENNSPQTKMAKAALAMSKQFAMIRRIQNAPNMTPEDKKRQIDLLTWGAMNIAQHANKNYYDAQKKLKGVE